MPTLDDIRADLPNWPDADKRQLRSLLNALLGADTGLAEMVLPRPLVIALASVSKHEGIHAHAEHLARLPKGREKLARVARQLTSSGCLETDIIEAVLRHAIGYRRGTDYPVTGHFILGVLEDYFNWLDFAYPSYWASRGRERERKD